MRAKTQTGRVYLYSRYERFWHWLQALLILALMATGFEIHGSVSLIGFERAASLHNKIGLTWLISFAFFVFWLFTTGEWKQYVPTTRKMLEMIRYYTHGIFIGRPHPCPKSKDAKHNPVQRLTYLALAAFLLPLQMASGLAYYLYSAWDSLGLGGLSLPIVAAAHLALAFALVSFLVVHVYMTTTGHSLLAHIKAMFTGYEETSAPAEDWEKRAV